MLLSLNVSICTVVLMENEKLNLIRNFDVDASHHPTGKSLPSFAVTPKEGQISVWLFPRPPRIEAVDKLVRVEYKGLEMSKRHETE
jgi:hypothetical protein